MIAVANIPLDLIKRLTVPFYIASAVLLALVPVFGLVLTLLAVTPIFAEN